MTSTPIQGTPRSLAEVEFVAGMRPCEACGDWEPVEWRTGGSGAIWIVSARCPRCATERRYVFQCDDDLIAAPHPRLQLGGPEPSQVVDPHALVNEIDRLIPAIVVEAERLVEPDWSRNYDRLERVLTALNELEKFVPDGEPDMPANAHRGEAGVEDQRARPERYTRQWITDERWRWNVVEKRFARDATRAFAMVPRPAPRGRINPAALDAHFKWTRRGGVGEGRLEVVGFDARQMKLDGVELSGARLETVRWSWGELSFLHLSDSELVDVEFTQARMNSARLDGASLRGCNFDGALLGLAVFDRARLAHCSLERVWMDRSAWRDAVVEKTSLRFVRFGDTLLDGARFVDCDLRDVLLVPKHPGIEASSRGTVFERCDFRNADFTARDLAGATLVACKFAGAHGMPGKIEGWSVRDADFSGAGDGSDLGGAERLLEHLRCV